MFSVTTHEIAEYIARSVKGAGEFITAMDPDNLSFDDIPNPADTPPAATASMAEQEIWKLQLRQYGDRITQREEASRQAFAVVLGQCSQTIRDHITASPSWTVLKANTNIMGLLRLIRQSLFKGATTKKNTEALQDAELSLYTFRQGETMTNGIYLEKYKGLIERYKHDGGQPGLQEI